MMKTKLRDIICDLIVSSVGSDIMNNNGITSDEIYGAVIEITQLSDQNARLVEEIGQLKENHVKQYNIGYRHGFRNGVESTGKEFDPEDI